MCFLFILSGQRGGGLMSGANKSHGEWPINWLQARPRAKTTLDQLPKVTSWPHVARGLARATCGTRERGRTRDPKLVAVRSEKSWMICGMCCYPVAAAASSNERQQQHAAAAAAAAEQRQLRMLFSSYPWLTAFGSSCGCCSIYR